MCRMDDRVGNPIKLAEKTSEMSTFRFDVRNSRSVLRSSKLTSLASFIEAPDFFFFWIGY